MAFASSILGVNGAGTLERYCAPSAFCVTRRAPDKGPLSFVRRAVPLVFFDRTKPIFSYSGRFTDRNRSLDVFAAADSGAADGTGPPPSAPLPPDLFDKGKTFVALMIWTPTSLEKNAEPVDQFELELRQPGQDWRSYMAWEKSSTGDTFDVYQCFQVDFLQPGSTYEFRVKAHNKFGWSEWSQPSPPVTTDSADAEKRVNAPTVGPAGILEYTPPQDRTTPTKKRVVPSTKPPSVKGKKNSATKSQKSAKKTVASAAAKTQAAPAPPPPTPAPTPTPVPIQSPPPVPKPQPKASISKASNTRSKVTTKTESLASVLKRIAKESKRSPEEIADFVGILEQKHWLYSVEDLTKLEYPEKTLVEIGIPIGLVIRLMDKMEETYSDDE